ncbi:hypothetical protein CDIK_3887 [Cucumispora dikerogammari]|nr:hypothetical protein CDIK_3887 [Cucumispora dikerogammari]
MFEILKIIHSIKYVKTTLSPPTASRDQLSFEIDNSSQEEQNNESTSISPNFEIHKSSQETTGIVNNAVELATDSFTTENNIGKAASLEHRTHKSLLNEFNSVCKSFVDKLEEKQKSFQTKPPDENSEQSNCNPEKLKEIKDFNKYLRFVRNKLEPIVELCSPQTHSSQPVKPVSETESENKASNVEENKSDSIMTQNNTTSGGSTSKVNSKKNMCKKISPNVLKISDTSISLQKDDPLFVSINQAKNTHDLQNASAVNLEKPSQDENDIYGLSKTNNSCKFDIEISELSENNSPYIQYNECSRDDDVSKNIDDIKKITHLNDKYSDEVEQSTYVQKNEGVNSKNIDNRITDTEDVLQNFLDNISFKKLKTIQKVDPYKAIRSNENSSEFKDVLNTADVNAVEYTQRDVTSKNEVYNSRSEVVKDQLQHPSVDSRYGGFCRASQCARLSPENVTSLADAQNTEAVDDKKSAKANKSISGKIEIDDKQAIIDTNDDNIVNPSGQVPDDKNSVFIVLGALLILVALLILTVFLVKFVRS